MIVVATKGVSWNFFWIEEEILFKRKNEEWYRKRRIKYHYLEKEKRKNTKKKKENESWERIANQSLYKEDKNDSHKCPCILAQREAKKDYFILKNHKWRRVIAENFCVSFQVKSPIIIKERTVPKCFSLFSHILIPKYKKKEKTLSCIKRSPGNT